jgi:hypothetical protein
MDMWKKTTALTAALILLGVAGLASSDAPHAVSATHSNPANESAASCAMSRFKAGGFWPWLPFASPAVSGQ